MERRIAGSANGRRMQSAGHDARIHFSAACWAAGTRLQRHLLEFDPLRRSRSLNRRRALSREASAAPKAREGSLDARGLRFGVVCARWNPTVTQALLDAALEALRRHGARASDVTVVRVPGAFELPAAARILIESRRCRALSILAAIVKGETSHHEVLAHAVAGALAAMSAESGLPIGLGLLTCDTMEQAHARVGKGAEAVEAALELANLSRALRAR
jgi:6,7-dimethyl-8-ribityllumazine synthase